ncbi:MAG: energy transducer TonB [Mucilaginibacter sp.]
MKKTLFTSFFILSLFTAKAQTADTSKQIFTAVEIEPSFPGGLGKFYEYLQANIVYPVESSNKNIQGKVFVTFVVEKDGSLTDVKILRGVSSDIDAEAIKVVNNSPKWKPSSNSGTPVRAQYSLPINFKLPPRELNNKIQTIEKLSPSQIDSIYSKKTFTAVEQEPEFPGGIDKFYKFLLNNLHYPDQARENNIRGKVFVSFVVDRDGSLIDIRILTSLSKETDEEALRLLKLSPKWKPGMQNGRPVRVAYTIPVPFPINE